MASVDEKQGHGRVLEFDKVTKSFAKTDSNEITHALAEVNLTIQPGEFVSIVGTSGWKINNFAIDRRTDQTDYR